MAIEGPMELTDEALLDRSLATLVESWDYLASGSPGAEVVRAEGAAIAAFVHAPDREFLNNALLWPGIADLGSTLATIERTYARHRVGRYAVWVHDSEAAVAAELEARGYACDSSTRALAMTLADPPAVDASVLELREPTLAEFWEVAGLTGLVPALAPERARFHLSRHGGVDAATLMAFDRDGDCGIYMVGTQPAARRRGIATALSAHAIAAARRRGCTTASLQATAMAETVYARVGFRDLGRLRELVPG
jgi:GNAT superfamily N-acetyltransferase